MKKILSILTAAVITASLFTGCGGSGKPTLKVFNCGEYIDESVLDDFTKETGIEVIYDTYETNEAMYTIMKADPTSYDVIVPSDYMAKRMIDEGLIAKINMDNIPNAQYIDPRFKGQYYDYNNEYTVPYMWGTMGIIYNKEKVTEPVDSWEILFDEKYSKQVLMLDSHRDTFVAPLEILGYSLNTTDDGELGEALDMLIAQKPNVRAYVIDQMNDMLLGEEALMSISWSGNAMEVISEEPDKFEYVIPKEGSNWFVDVMCVSSKSKNIDLAEKFIDFMCRKDIAVKNCNETRYSTPHTQVRDEMMKIDPDFANSKAAFPESEDLINMEMFISNDEINRKYDELWQKLKSK